MDQPDARVLRFPTPKLAPISFTGTLLDPEVQRQVATGLAEAAERMSKSFQEMARQMSEAASRVRQP